MNEILNLIDKAMAADPLTLALCVALVLSFAVLRKQK